MGMKVLRKNLGACQMACFSVRGFECSQSEDRA
jgi:hypothetical protein